MSNDSKIEVNCPACYGLVGNCERCKGTGTIPLPTNLEVCGRCGGKGVHDHEAFANGITMSEMRDFGPDFREEYMSGKYDVVCSVCKGRNVVPVIDTARCAPELLAAYRDDQEARAECEAIHAAELRMGA